MVLLICTQISSYRHAVIHYCVGWCVVTVQQRHKLFLCFGFFSHSPFAHSSHTGEQHRATGCAAWRGSGCTKEHLWHGLPEGGQTRTSASQRYVCPPRLLQQYVYTSWCFSFHSSIMIHGLPALMMVQIWMFYTRNQLFFSLFGGTAVLILDHCSLPKTAMPTHPHSEDSECTRIHLHTRAHTHTHLSAATTSTVFCLPLSVDGFSHPTCSWSPRSWRLSNFHRTEI